MKQSIAFSILLTVLFCSSYGQNTDGLEEQFSSLPESVEKPWCYYYWINDDISMEGITYDFLAMKEAGIGTVLIGNINLEGIDGPVPLFSEEWWEIMVHAVSEGKRIGIDVGLFNSPGWSQSGGPWNSPEKAMRHIVSSEIKVSGPGQAKLVLPKPDSLFQDINVLAFPSVESETNITGIMAPKVSSRPKLNGLENLSDGNFTTETILRKSKYKIDLLFPESFEANSLIIYPSREIIADAQLYALVNGKDSLIREFKIDRRNFMFNVGPIFKGPLAISVPGIKSQKFSLVLKNIMKLETGSGLTEVVVSGKAVVERFIEKQLGIMYPTPLPEWNSYSWEQPAPITNPNLLLGKENILDISSHLQADGNLIWEIPEGNWTIVRFGLKPTGVKNHPAAPQGIGYEVDKMDSKKVREHFEKFVGEFLKRIPEESKPALKYVIIDSYEVGSQNWTDGYELKFAKKYGYDPIPYLPVLTGRVVGSVTESERFLWDLRRAIADDIAYEYVGGLKKISNEHNMQLWLENYGHWGYPSEFLMYGGQTDLVAGEFWNEGTLGNIECKAASSAAHIYGKPRVSAEAFTASGKTFVRHPAMLKARGDWSFTEGINHFVLHVYIHQPDNNRKPGVNTWFGTEFNRHNTWFGYASYWTDYLKRCQILLQHGNYVADVCYFIGEEAPIMTGGRIPELPQGFSFDFINAEIILSQLKVENGRFVLPNGMTYRMMVLPPLKTMRPEVIKKLQELVEMGGIIYGSPPERSPSLQNYPECDREVQEIAKQLWGDENTTDVVHNFGSGKVFNNCGFEEVLEKIGLNKDVDLRTDDHILWTHRSSNERDIYFISNQKQTDVEFTPSFRVSGKTPQLWNPLTGEIRLLKGYVDNGTRTEIPLRLSEYGSCFIVFSEAVPENINDRYTANFPNREVILRLDDNWQVTFLDSETGPSESMNFPVLTDWTENKNEKIRYYSGSARYSKTFNLKELEEGKEYFINLGNVQVMSRVKLNGEIIGGTWISPHCLYTKGFLKEGENRIEIEVVNTWRNRLIKEKSLPENKRKAWWNTDDIRPRETLRPAGLLGPVTIEKRVDN